MRSVNLAIANLPDDLVRNSRPPTCLEWIYPVNRCRTRYSVFTEFGNARNVASFFLEASPWNMPELNAGLSAGKGKGDRPHPHRPVLETRLAEIEIAKGDRRLRCRLG
ncbi:MAG: hypothetical protein AAFX40_06655 [Cyanobacteria bacterium J06639_1]